MDSVQGDVRFAILPLPQVNVSIARCSSCGLPVALVNVQWCLMQRNIYTQTCSDIIKPHRVFQSVF